MDNVEKMLTRGLDVIYNYKEELVTFNCNGKDITMPLNELWRVGELLDRIDIFGSYKMNCDDLTDEQAAFAAVKYCNGTSLDSDEVFFYQCANLARDKA